MNLALVALTAVAAGACATVPSPRQMVDAVVDAADGRSPEEAERDSVAEVIARARSAVPASPLTVQPATAAGARVWKAGVVAKGLRILVGTESRGLWLMRDTTVLFHAPVAVGMEEGFTYNGRRYDFTTPVGRRQVLGKGTEPLWVPPDWHYFEIALERDLDVVPLRKGRREVLGDGTHLEIRGDDVGRVNQFGNFWPFTPGTEIIFDGKVFVPPFGSRQRQIPEVLGTHKLIMGDGYLIHGTNEDASVGDAVSHGCVRMFNEDVAELFSTVPVGTPVFIF
ncbi:MAG: L,D-transpeptidase [Gemmatimonadota bacterium]